MADLNARILLVDDEVEIRRLLRVALDAYGYSVIEAETGRDGIRKAALDHPDIMILDMGLPDIEGLEVIRNVREWSSMPIIILSVREREKDKVAALDSGASDYVVKPFNMGELMARVRVALRSLVPGSTDPVIEIGDLRMDLSRRVTAVGGKEIKLTPTEYELLKLLAINAGKVITQKQLLEHIWDTKSLEHTQYLRVYVSQLRKKIELDPSHPRYLLTEPGVGYRLASSDV
ncbi:MAG: response regulator [Actinobacteria bacterium]|nr:response regulator [Actinomycetota bacterium]